MTSQACAHIKGESSHDIFICVTFMLTVLVMFVTCYIYVTACYIYINSDCLSWEDPVCRTTGLHISFCT